MSNDLLLWGTYSRDAVQNVPLGPEVMFDTRRGACAEASSNSNGLSGT